MKKYLIFGSGVLTGIILTFLVALIYNANNAAPQNENIRWFDKPGDIIEIKSFEVFQVLGDNAALAWGENVAGEVYVITNDEGKFYYDEEVIKVPKDKVVRQVGIYHYMTRNETDKTVRIVRIMDE